jgi:phosphoenolpyruvate-protein kinase (PTS system EI component)
VVRWQEARNEVKLEGTTICPSIGVGRVRVLDRELVIPRNRIPAGQVQWEQQRYSEAVKTVGGHLREHIEEDHSGSLLSASLILMNHEAMLTDKQFHEAVRSRILAESRNAAWALELEAKKIIIRLEASRSPYLKSRAEDVRDLTARAQWEAENVMRRCFSDRIEAGNSKRVFL